MPKNKNAFKSRNDIVIHVASALKKKFLNTENVMVHGNAFEQAFMRAIS